MFEKWLALVIFLYQLFIWSLSPQTFILCLSCYLYSLCFLTIKSWFFSRSRFISCFYVFLNFFPMGTVHALLDHWCFFNIWYKDLDTSLHRFESPKVSTKLSISKPENSKRNTLRKALLSWKTKCVVLTNLQKLYTFFRRQIKAMFLLLIYVCCCFHHLCY